MNWNCFAKVADVIGVFSFVLSVFIMIKTGSIKKKLENEMNLKKKITLYGQNREHYSQELCMCSQCLANLKGECTVSQAQEYIIRISQVISDLKIYHPSLSAEDKKAIKRLEKYFSDISGKKSIGGKFSFLHISTDLAHIISILKAEAY